jgi:hypothetical protein
VLAYLVYLSVVTGDPMHAFAAQGEWSRLMIPFMGGAVLGLWGALTAVVELLPGISILQLRPSEIPELIAVRNLILFGFFALAVWALCESVKRLPAAYTAWALSALVLPLSVPALNEPLKSLPRFMLVLFPLWIALALWAQEKGRLRPVLVISGSLLVLSSALFTTWVYPP